MPKSNRFYTYLHRFKNGTLYAGKGTAGRAYQFSRGRHNIHWDRLFTKYGRPAVKILANNLEEADALALEVQIIARLKLKGRPICNSTDGGNGCVGMRVTPETREKLRAANSGERNRMFGKYHSQEARDAISAANKGRYLGSKSARYNHEVLSFTNDKTGEVFSGTRWELTNFKGVPQPAVSSLCNGDIASIHGWRLSSTRPEDTGKSGRRHGRYDHKIYDFLHDSGIEESCTKNDLCIKYSLPFPSNISSLCKNKIRSYKGWRLRS